MIQVDRDVCVLCGLCTGVCPPNALELTPDRLLVLSHCSGCGWCVSGLSGRCSLRWSIEFGPSSRLQGRHRAALTSTRPG